MESSHSSKAQRNSGGARPKRFGCETPRVFTPPLRPLTRETTLGYDVIDFARDVLGINLFPWQRWLLIHMLELLEDGSLRFRTVVVLVARQNGKSTLSQVLALWFMIVWGWPLVLGTAQDLETAEEVWQGAVDLVEEDEELSKLLKRVVKVNGKKALELTTGARYKVKAANRRAGRGFSGNLIMLDELREHQSWDAWGAITKTTMARVEALVLALSNAGDATSIVLRYLRKMAHAAVGDPDGICDSDDPRDMLPSDAEVDQIDLEDDLDVEDFEQDADTLGLFEWSAPPGCDKWDRDGWAQGNPAMNHPDGIPERNIAAACKTDPEWVFRTEVLCQWSDGSLEGPFPPGQWERGTDFESRIAEGAPLSFCLDVSGDRTHSHIGVSGKRADGLLHVEVVASRAGTDWPVAWFSERASVDNPMTVVVQERGAPASSLIDDLEAIEGLAVVRWGGADLGNATARIYDLVNASALIEVDGASPRREGLCHLPQPVLDVAAATAVPKILSDGGMAWDRRKSPTDIAPLVAVTGALWHALQREEPSARSAYEDRGLVTIDL